MGDKPALKLSPIFFLNYFSKYFLSHYHSFSLVLKHRKTVHFRNVIQSSITAYNHLIVYGANLLHIWSAVFESTFLPNWIDLVRQGRNEVFEMVLRSSPHVFIWKRRYFVVFPFPVHRKRCTVFDENANFWKRSPEWKALKTQRYRIEFTGEKNRKPPQKKTTIGHVISVPVHLHSKIQDGGGIDREVFVVFPVISLLFCLILNYQFNASLLNNAFYTCAVELGSVFSLVRPQYFHSVSSEMKRWTLGDAFEWTGPSSYVKHNT